jgi:hypothetical protein
MNRLILDFVEKFSKGYIIHYIDYSSDYSKGSIFLPNKILNEYASAEIKSKCKYKIRFLKRTKYEDVSVTVTKINSPNKSKERYIKLEFNDSVLYAPYKLLNKNTKSYCFQAFIDINIYDNNGLLLYRSYKFLKNYDTRSKAKYYIRKYAKRFGNIHKKWYINDTVEHDLTDDIIELFNGDMIYSHSYAFNCKNSNNIAIYTYTIMSIERE